MCVAVNLARETLRLMSIRPTLSVHLVSDAIDCRLSDNVTSPGRVIHSDSRNRFIRSSFTVQHAGDRHRLNVHDRQRGLCYIMFNSLFGFRK